MILYRKAVKMCTYDSILHRGPEPGFLYRLIRSLYLVNICTAGVYSGIQWNIYVKHFDIPPPLAFSPSLRSQD